MAFEFLAMVPYIKTLGDVQLFFFQSRSSDLTTQTTGPATETSIIN